MVCVACDGHGDQGEVVAERVTRMLPLLLDKHIPSMSLVEALPQAFMGAQADLEQCFKSAQFYSGATMAVFCIHQDSHEAWFAHAGDSLAVLGDLATGRTRFITKEHKAHNPTEFQRLESCGAQVIKKRYEDGETVSRVFIPQTGVPGLAMSRSLGDGCLKKYGVVADPEVHDISDHWKSCRSPCVLMATDGLWDTMDPEEALVEFAGRRRRGLEVLAGAEALVRRSQKLWIESEGDYCDDVTVLFMAPSAGLLVEQ
jgi:serine/threonine protein phosphatase PrpC